MPKVTGIREIVQGRTIGVPNRCVKVILWVAKKAVMPHWCSVKQATSCKACIDFPHNHLHCGP